MIKSKNALFCVRLSIPSLVVSNCQTPILICIQMHKSSHGVERTHALISQLGHQTGSHLFGYNFSAHSKRCCCYCCSSSDCLSVPLFRNPAFQWHLFLGFFCRFSSNWIISQRHVLKDSWDNFPTQNSYENKWTIHYEKVRWPNLKRTWHNNIHVLNQF